MDQREKPGTSSHEEISGRAYGVYLNRMRDGNDYGQVFGEQMAAEQDWFEAEYELQHGLPLP